MNRFRNINEDYQPECHDRFERHVNSQKVVSERFSEDVLELDDENHLQNEEKS